MSGPKINSFWSATVLDQDGSVIYSLNSRTAIDNKLDLILLDQAATLRLRELQPPEAESAIIVESQVDEGFIVLRVLRPDESWIDKSNSFLNSVTCRPYQLAPAEAASRNRTPRRSLTLRVAWQSIRRICRRTIRQIPGTRIANTIEEQDLCCADAHRRFAPRRRALAIDWQAKIQNHGHRKLRVDLMQSARLRIFPAHCRRLHPILG